MHAAFYRGTRPGLPGLYNRLARWWTRGKYSHCELVFSDGVAASASFLDGGVRFKKIEFNPDKWDFIELPAHKEAAARAWFVKNEGKNYDLIGNVRFVLGFIEDHRDKWSCAEAVADALSITDAWRYEPNILASTLRIL